MSKKITGQATPPRVLPYVVATDGSAVKTRGKTDWHTGFGWVASDGTWQLGACPIPVELAGRSGALVSELRAIYHAAHTRLPDGAVALVSDCEQALRYLDSWSRGDVGRMPPGYVGSGSHAPMLHRLARLVYANRERIAWTLVRGHRGHLLNEAADSLAGIGRRWCSGTYTEAEAERRGRRLVEGFMADPRLAEAVA